jgi:hypothetical protein
VKISDLDPAQLARHAQNVFLFQGRHHACARLSYHALKLDPHQPLALRTLSDFLSGDQVRESGWEQLSAAVLEYALRPGSAVPESEHAGLKEHLFLAKWSWAFVKRRDGKTSCTWEELQDRSLFTEDEARYREFLAAVTARCGTLENAFQAAHTLAGVLGRLLVHGSDGIDAKVEEIFVPGRFVEAPEYAQWLASSTDPLDKLERERQRKAKKTD